MIVQEKVSIGISACMYGSKVWHNREGWDLLEKLGCEADLYEWHPICAEIEAGLGAPRIPVQVLDGNGIDVWDDRARVMQGNSDITDRLKAACLQALKRLQIGDVHAFVFKETSPSCGVYRVLETSRQINRPPGVFGALLYREGFFLIPAEDLKDPVKWWDWRRRLFAYLWLQDQTILSLVEFYEAWHEVKLLCQDLDNERARDMGKTFAQFDKKTPIANLEYQREQILDLIRKPSDFPRIAQSLLKSYLFFCKQLKIEIDESAEPVESLELKHLVEEVRALEIVGAKQEIFFGGSPILYRSQIMVEFSE